ncbi:hypothetical protein VPNG_02826 [Cytospora leucostoma]|uniref:RRM domain-containing protein n=1 Tax=Cytospora leucostoma TaxID=1230097 RepID=A0A423XJ54_9PEZI|nr:hypothetical protein VPNG_02826 [Cytospora leucostoma]
MDLPSSQREESDVIFRLPSSNNEPDRLGHSSQNSFAYLGREPDDQFEQNAALWLTHLPPDCTVRQLIRAIISVGPTGRILFCKIVRPYLPEHTWAAKVVFATRPEAQRLIAVSRCNQFIMQYRHIYVDWHRVLSTSFYAIEPITRVLIIEGPLHIVNRPGLQAYFKKLTRIDTEEVIELGARYDRQRACIVWRFGSWFGQAEAAAAALAKDYADMVDVRYGLDPFSILYLTLSQAIALNFLAPLGAIILAKCLDHGVLGLVDRVGGFVALAGVFLVVQPGQSFIRGDNLSSSATNEASERLKGVACGIVGVFGGIEVLLTAGISSDASSAATVMIYSQVIWALALDRIIWHVSLNVWTLIGVTSVVFSLALVSLAKEVTTTSMQGGLQYESIPHSTDIDLERLCDYEGPNGNGMA